MLCFEGLVCLLVFFLKSLYLDPCVCVCVCGLIFKILGVYSDFCKVKTDNVLVQFFNCYCNIFLFHSFLGLLKWRVTRHISAPLIR